MTSCRNASLCATQQCSVLKLSLFSASCSLRILPCETFRYTHGLSQCRQIDSLMHILVCLSYQRTAPSALHPVSITAVFLFPLGLVHSTVQQPSAALSPFNLQTLIQQPLSSIYTVLSAAFSSTSSRPTSESSTHAFTKSLPFPHTSYILSPVPISKTLVR